MSLAKQAYIATQSLCYTMKQPPEWNWKPLSSFAGFSIVRWEICLSSCLTSSNKNCASLAQRLDNQGLQHGRASLFICFRQSFAPASSPTASPLRAQRAFVKLPPRSSISKMVGHKTGTIWAQRGHRHLRIHQTDECTLSPAEPAFWLAATLAEMKITRLGTAYCEIQ